ncbi:CinA family nicotinamide mononucleotide deamidase-related protein [Calycomorphotria hydatis]|uniref:CinA-like protein n=1 Tax=Calycomorphotria hydatis TaxID=2528027 RepID=A0A517TBF4_9PLAN|nr:CinA family nicotinamide mononucleotide deamidase-related protein [Calycomorphotria hydatis]QDT65701.1 Putative competence-damage inducible protein [Calycomorphotria hydatis]
MRGEILAVGTELTNGSKLDTNSQWLCNELAAVGVTVVSTSTIRDELDEMAEVIARAATRRDLLIITGGLGPTLDDLTREALSVAFDQPLTLHEESVQHIEHLFASRGREMPERNRLQAMFPLNATPIPNPVGTAPGIWMEIPRANGKQSNGAACRIAALPGVPFEMKRLFQDYVRPRVSGNAGIIRRARVNVFGAGESRVEELLGELTARGREPEVGITAHAGTITLRISANGRDESECDAQISTVKLSIQELLGDLVFAEEDDQLEHVILELLSQRGETLSVVEHGTGGLLNAWLSEADSSHQVFRGGSVITTSDLETEATTPLGQLLNTSVAREDVIALAHACRGAYQTNYAIAAIRPQSDETKDGNPFRIAVAGRDKQLAVTHQPVTHDFVGRNMAAKTGLNLLRLDLMREQSAPNP